ncbi:MAG: endonuclease III [Acidobacteria bacterium]|nr:endonuclease III [Acidobacteriota bacterium]MCA1608492.1 endonuclease III [Acidobacteriota bacterium]
MTDDRKTRVRTIIRRLKKAYPDAHCELNHANAFELLVATILSAQCTDKRVNIVTENLFRKYRGPHDYLNAEWAELEKDIHSTGFFRNKAKNIKGACQRILDNFNGEIPSTMNDLLSLPGVARKTANVVLGNAYGIMSGIVVDTHVARLAQRLGLTAKIDAVKIEIDLQEIVSKKNWIMFPHWLIFHGRRICEAKKPKCLDCVLSDLCPSFEIFTNSNVLMNKPRKQNLRARLRRDKEDYP